MRAAFTYQPVGATRPAAARWVDSPPGLRRFEKTVTIGTGVAFWESTADEVLRWGIKRRSGFRVRPGAGAGERVTDGADYTVTAGWGPVTIREPVRVVAVVDEPDRRGFAYGTLPGHPVSGEEAFIVHRAPDGSVHLTLRSLTRPAERGFWRAVFPILLLAQRFYRRRYLRVF
ncbi:DUF1990 family protein [Nocardia takedensis]